MISKLLVYLISFFISLTVAQQNSTCPAVVATNVIFVMDESSACSNTNFNDQKQAVSSMAYGILNNPQNMVTVISYGTYGRVEVQYATDPQYVQNVLSYTNQFYGASNLKYGLISANNYLTGTNDIIVLFACGSPSFNLEPYTYASTLKAKGVKFVTVILNSNSYVKDTIVALASTPRDQNSFQYPDGSALISYGIYELFPAVLGISNPGSTCIVQGNQQITTFDGNYYGFNGEGVYYLAQETGLYSVQALVKKCVNNYSCVKGIGVDLPTMNLQFTLYHYSANLFQIYLNSGLITADQYAANGIVVKKIAPSGQYMIVPVQDPSIPSLELLIDEFGIYTKLSAAPRLYNSTSGLCGNFNGCSDDDIEGDGIEYVKNALVDSSSTLFDGSLVHIPTIYNINVYQGGDSAQDVCKNLPAGLQRRCNHDVVVFGSSAVNISQNLFFSECTQFCISGHFDTAILQASDCSDFCLLNPFEPTTDLNTLMNNTYYTPDSNFATDVFAQNARFYQEDPLEGTKYVVFQGVDGFNRPIETKFYIRFECQDPVPNVDVPDTIDAAASAFFDWPEIRIHASVSAPVKRVQWAVLVYPGVEAPLLNGANGLYPYFSPNEVGTYILQTTIYDGCHIVTKNVTINVDCPNAAFEAPVGFINPQTYMTMATYAYSFLSFSTVEGVIDSIQWSLDTNLTQLDIANADELSWDNVTYYEYLVGFKNSEMLVNATNVTGTAETSTNVNTNYGNYPLTNSLSRKGVYWFQQTNTNVTTTTKVDIENNLYKIQRDFCLVYFFAFGQNNGELEFFLEHYNGMKYACNGRYAITVNYGNKCSKKQDTVFVDVGCGPKPHALISYCNVPGQSPSCSANNVSQSLSGSTLSNYYDYTGRSFQRQYFQSYEDYDDLGRYLTRTWQVTDNTNYPDANPNSLLSATNSELVNFVPIAEGSYTISLTADNGCNNGTDSVTVNAVCTETCTGGIVNNGSQSLVIDTVNWSQEFTFVSTTSNTTCLKFYAYEWSIISYPSIYDEDAYVFNMLGLSPLPLGADSNTWFPVPNFNFFPETSGSYSVLLTVTDGCKYHNSTASVQATCPGTLGGSVNYFSTVRNSPQTGLFPSQKITFSSTGNNVTSYWWFLSQYNGQNALTSLGFGSELVWSPSEGGVYDFFVYVSDGCNYVKKTFTITASCSDIGTLSFSSSNGYSGQIPSFNGFDLVSSFQTIPGYIYEWNIVQAPQGSFANIGLNYPNVTFGPDMPGTYSVVLSVIDPCGNIVNSAPKTFTASVSYTVNLETTWQSPVTVVSLNPDIRYPNDYEKFPLVRLSADSSIFANITYDQLRASGQWYVVKAPKYSAYAPYSINEVTESQVNVQSIANVTIDDETTFYIEERQVAFTYTTTYTTTEFWTYINTQCTNVDHTTYFPACFRPDYPGEYQLQLSVTASYGEIYYLPSPVTIRASCGSSNFSQSVMTELDFALNEQIRINVTEDQVLSTVPASYNYKSWQLFQVYTDPNNSSDITINNLFSIFNNYGSEISFYIPDATASYLLELTATDNCYWMKQNVTLNIDYPPVSNFSLEDPQVISDFTTYKQKEASDDGFTIYVFSIQSNVFNYIEFLANIKAIGFPVYYLGSEIGASEHKSGTVISSNSSQGEVLSAGAIAGIVIGVVAGIILLIILVILVRRLKTTGGAENLKTSTPAVDKEQQPQ